MRLRLVQLDGGSGDQLSDRVARVASLVAASGAVDLVVLPELWAPGAFAYRAWKPGAQPLDGPIVQAMSGAARRAGVHVHMGSFIERDGEDLYNTSVVLGPDGVVAAVYRKVHLFGFSEGEPTLLTAGRQPVVWSSPWGMVGLTTCYDLRFPELYRALVDAGAELAIVVAGWPAARIEHWRLLVRARAVENQLLVIACNTAGQQGSVPLGGSSLVVDAWGTVVAEAGADADIVDVDLDPAAVTRTRAAFPVLADRRMALHSIGQ